MRAGPGDQLLTVAGKCLLPLHLAAGASRRREAILRSNGRNFQKIAKLPSFQRTTTRVARWNDGSFANFLGV
jgi:hypothetical protein